MTVFRSLNVLTIFRLSRLESSIDKAVYEVEKYGSDFNSLSNPHIKDTLKVLGLLKEDCLENGLEIRERILRAFKDICTSTAIHWEETNFSRPLFDVYNLLEKSIPAFGSLELLRNDFGKADPI